MLLACFIAASAHALALSLRSFVPVGSKHYHTARAVSDDARARSDAEQHEDVELDLRPVFARLGALHQRAVHAGIAAGARAISEEDQARRRAGLFLSPVLGRRESLEKTMTSQTGKSVISRLALRENVD